ncbi:MAG: hypothetical protein IJK61_03170, partial [Bacteroidetes bacterium]|nr:hypothetical protein [Bacteroidota bacterium]
MLKYISKYNICFIWLFIFIFLSSSIYSQDKRVTNVMVPGLDSIFKGKPIIMYDHTELNGNNKYIYLCGVVNEHEYFDGGISNPKLPDFGLPIDELYTPIFYKLNYENGHLNYLWSKKYYTGYMNKLAPQTPFTGQSFYYLGKGTMYQNSSGGFDIISSVSNYKSQLQKMMILSFDSEGSLISEMTNIDTNLLLHNYAEQTDHNCMPTYIRNKENKTYYLFRNLNYDYNSLPQSAIYKKYDKYRDSLNLYQGNWVALEFNSLGNYIEKHNLFSINELAQNNKYKQRQGREIYNSRNNIAFSDKQDNIYILDHIQYSGVNQDNGQHYVYHDNLIIKLNKNLEKEFYVFEKDINPDESRDANVMSAAVDKQDNILISFKYYDKMNYVHDYNLPLRDTLYYLTKLSGKTGEVLGIKNID